ncbi:MAG: glycosyltransferase, partial [Candidatus Omnitrophica bacterium]|nr:glycosyltransferase [Candidatus Omnitrophota bacterium]
MTETGRKIKSLTAFCYEFPPIGGGAGNALRHLCREWSAQGIEVTVVTSSQFQKDITEASEGFSVIRINVGRKEVGRGRIPEMIRYMIRSTLKGIELSRNRSSDLNIAFMSLPSGFAPWILSKKFKTPYVTELRGGDVPGFDPKHLNIYHSVLKPFTRSVWSRSSCLIANGSGLQS